MGKKAVIVVSLVEESAEKPNEEIETMDEGSGEGHGYRDLTDGLSSAFHPFCLRLKVWRIK